MQNVGVLQQNWLYETLGICYWCVKIPQCGYMGDGLKPITFYVQKHTLALEKCHNPPLVREQAARSVRICETGLFPWHVIIILHGLNTVECRYNAVH